ncbi:hypothetical protein Tco_0642735 [Tanacetum coccineum]
MFLNMDQLEKKLDKKEFQEIGSMAAFKVLETQFQMFIKSRIYLDDEYVVMTRNYFLQYTQLEIPEFCDTLIQHMESVKKSINERAQHKREYDSWVNERQMQTTEEKVDTSKALDASLVDTKSSGTELKVTYSHTEQPDSIMKERSDQMLNNVMHMYFSAKLTDKPVQLKLSNQSLFASQVDVNNDLSKPVTTHYLPKERESVVVKPHHVIASSESRNSSKNMPRFSSNDMVHNHYLEEAKKKTQESSRNSRPNGLRWVPTGKLFTSSTTKADSEPTNGSNEDITNQYECEQTLDVSAGTLKLSAGTSFIPKKEGLRVCSELEIHDHNNKPSSSKLVPKVPTPADKTATSQQELELLFHHHITMLRKTSSFQQSSIAHAQTTKTYYKHQDSRIKKAQALKTKTSANSDIKDNSSETKLRGRLLESFQEDAKYDHVGQETRSQGGKDNQD